MTIQEAMAALRSKYPHESLSITCQVWQHRPREPLTVRFSIWNGSTIIEAATLELAIKLMLTHCDIKEAETFSTEAAAQQPA